MNAKQTKWSSVSPLAVLLVSYLLTACAATADNNGEDMTEIKTLQETSWWVEDIAGKGVVDMSHTTIEFDADGRIGGSTGCNRYFGSVEINGSALKTGPLAGTRKACSGALMDQENKFFEAMSRVVSWEIAETDLLHLKDSDGNTQLRAFRTEQ